MNTLLTVLTILTAAGLAAFVYARFVEPRLLVTEEVTIVSPHVTGAAEGLRIVQFSDVHVSEDDHRSKYTDLVRAINAQEPDLLVFTGDLFSSYRNYEGSVEKIAEAFASMQGKYGKLAVLGNHDYGREAPEATVKLLRDAGFTVLLGERLVLDELGITVTGFDDALFGEPPSETALDGAEGFHLVLAHEGDLADSVDTSKFDLMLSGHTHGGQVALPFKKALYLPKLGRHYARGLYRLEGGSMLYVNRGIGESLMPIRVGSFPEITVLTLTRG